jgi:hypothetical protein
MPRQRVEIDTLERDKWREQFSAAGLDFVPDPMVLRTGELFLGGSEAAKQEGRDPETVWEAIDKNLSGLLTFFDILIARERIPYIQYWETFPLFGLGLPELLGPLLVHVTVAPPVYGQIKAELLERLQNTNFRQLPDELVEDVRHELGAYVYEWKPALGGLIVPQSHWQVAQFLVGGMIFGNYALAAGVDHLIHSKRSRLFVELSIPENERVRWGHRMEKELFEDFRKHCIETGRNVRVSDFNSAPPILPLLLDQMPSECSPHDLLERALEIRESELGEDYRAWQARLRDAWSRGDHDERAEDSAQKVLNEIRARVPSVDISSTGTRLDLGMSVDANGPKGELKVKDIPLRLPEWLRPWVIESLMWSGHPHRKLLLHMSLSARRYSDLTMHLRKIWFSKPAQANPK